MSSIYHVLFGPVSDVPPLSMSHYQLNKIQLNPKVGHPHSLLHSPRDKFIRFFSHCIYWLNYWHASAILDTSMISLMLDDDTKRNVIRSYNRKI